MLAARMFRRQRRRFDLVMSSARPTKDELHRRFCLRLYVVAGLGTVGFVLGYIMREPITVIVCFFAAYISLATLVLIRLSRKPRAR